jgi:thymidylate kinase
LWIPDQSAEFAYLLSKKAWKRSISANQVQRLQYLAAKLGTINAREIAGQLFLRNVACKVVESTAAGNLDCMIHALGWETWHKSFRQQPCRAARYLFEDILRRIKRWMRPTGLFVVIVGPDGIGKSTMIASVLKTVSPCFRRRASFHWRPGWIRFNRREVISRGPHDLPPRGRMSSIFAILIYFADYWLGYIMGIRVMLARSGLVLFDRYFYDISIDPLRFRIKGCRWLVRLLERMVPQPDLVIVLDASETTVHQRKQELTLEEIRRQRQAYRQLARRSRVPTIISASGDIKATTKAVSDEILRFLAGRLQNRTVFASKRMFND